MNVIHQHEKRFVWVLSGLLLVLPLNKAVAFCEKRNDGSTCHKHMVDGPLNFLREDLHEYLKRAVLFPDHRALLSTNTAEHFDSCNLDGGTARINSRLTGSSGALALFSPDSSPDVSSFGESDVFAGTREWAAALHGAQDFYAHSNWVEMTMAGTVYGVQILSRDELIDDGLGLWRVIKGQWTLVRPNIISSQSVLPQTWTSDNPIGESNRSGRLPRVKDDKGNEYWLLITGKSTSRNKCPVKKNLKTGAVTRLSMAHDSLNKDNINRTLHFEAQMLASRQTRHEWCRLMHLARDTKGLPAVSVLMGLMVEPGKSPHIAGTACASPDSGPIDVTVTVDRIKVLDDHNSLAAPGDLNYTLSLYTKDLRRSVRSQGKKVVVDTLNDVPASGRPRAVSLCVASNEQVVATVQGWEDDDMSESEKTRYRNTTKKVWLDRDKNGQLTRVDDVLVGTTHTIGSGANIAHGNNLGRFTLHSDNPDIKDMEVDITVSNRGIDEDTDGLTLCQERIAGTEPTVADTDGDGRNDGDEVAMGSDPLVADAHEIVTVDAPDKVAPAPEPDQSTPSPKNKWKSTFGSEMVVKPAKVCGSKNASLCKDFGATCDLVHATNGSTSDLCHWSSENSVAACKRTVGIWTTANSKYAKKHPGAVKKGHAGACITEAKNLINRIQ